MERLLIRAYILLILQTISFRSFYFSVSENYQCGEPLAYLIVRIPIIDEIHIVYVCVSDVRLLFSHCEKLQEVPKDKLDELRPHYYCWSTELVAHSSDRKKNTHKKRFLFNKPCTPSYWYRPSTSFNVLMTRLCITFMFLHFLQIVFIGESSKLQNLRSSGEKNWSNLDCHLKTGIRLFVHPSQILFLCIFVSFLLYMKITRYPLPENSVPTYRYH